MPQGTQPVQTADPIPGWLSVDGQRYEIASLALAAAEPGVPTLVFLHEGLGCVALWRDFPERLVARTGLPGFLYSRLGYGRSDPRPGPLPLDYHEPAAVDELPKILAAAGITRPLLIGHSDGGTIALLYAARGVRPPPLAVVTLAAHVFNEEVTIAGIERTKVAFETTDLRARLARYHGENVDGAFRGWCDVWLSAPFRDWNIESCLPAIRCPLLVIQGEEDPYGSPRQVSAICAGAGGEAEPALLPALGHAPHLEDPDTVIATISDFLGRHHLLGRHAGARGG